MAMASPSSRTQTSPRSYSSPFASTSATNFSPQPYSTANVRVNDHRPSASVRFLSVEQMAEEFPGRRSMTVTPKSQRNSDMEVSSSSSSSSAKSSEKRTCMCSPTTHPGSFRCAYHKQLAEKQKEQKQTTTTLSGGRKLNLLRSAMKNSVVRIGGVEGEFVRRALTILIRPSSHHLRRREAFRPRPTRLSLMSKAQAQTQTQTQDEY